MSMNKDTNCHNINNAMNHSLLNPGHIFLYSLILSPMLV
jgi:hypothetical protein